MYDMSDKLRTRGHALNPVPQQQHLMDSFHHGDTSLPPGSTPYLMVARRFTHFSIFFYPRGGAPHKESQPPYILREHAHVPAEAERTHKARISFFSRLTRTQRARAHFNLQHWFLYHMGLY